MLLCGVFLLLTFCLKLDGWCNFRDSKVAQLLRDSLGNITCRTCMIAHVSQEVPHYNESLQVIQLAARIHRMRRRKVRGVRPTFIFILFSYIYKKNYMFLSYCCGIFSCFLHIDQTFYTHSLTSKKKV